MFFAIPILLLVPVGVVAILLTAFEGLLYPGKFWKFLWAFLGAVVVANEVIPKLGIDEKYTLGVTLVIMTILLLTQSWRWLTPFWIFFFVSLVALMIVMSIVSAALGLELYKETYNADGSLVHSATAETFVMWSMVWMSGISAAVGTVLLNLKVYRKDVQKKLGKIVAARDNDNDDLPACEDNPVYRAPVHTLSSTRQMCGASRGRLTCMKMKYHLGDHVALDVSGTTMKWPL